MRHDTKHRTTMLGGWTRYLGSTLTLIVIASAVVLSQQAHVLSSPADLATNQSTTVQVQWTAAPGDSVYHVQIDTSIAFQSTTVNDSSLTGTSYSITGLRNATKNYWRGSVK